MNQARGVGQAKQMPTATPAKGAKQAAEGTDYFRAPKYNGGNGDLRDTPMDSITPSRVWQSVRMRWNPIRGLTFERLVSYLDQFSYGHFRQAGMMWEKMLGRDYQLKIAAPKRFKAVARHGYDVVVLDNLSDAEKADAEEQQEFLKDFYDNVTTTEAMKPDRTGGLALLLRQMMEAHYYHYAIHEIVWQPQKDGSLSAKFIYCPIWWFEGVRGKLRYLQSEFQAWGEEMNDGEWLITCGDGLAEVCSIIYMLKHGAIRSWVAMLEKFGMPGLLGKTHAKKGTPEWNAMNDALVRFGEEWSTVVGGCAGDLKENDISLVQASNTANGEAFDNLVEKLDRAQTQLFRGGDLGTSSGQDRQGASLQGDESEILETDDAKLLEETLTSHVSRVALTWKFGADAKQLVYLKLRTTPQEDHKTDIEAMQFVLANGGELPMASTYEKLGLVMPKDGDEVLQMPQQQMGGGQSPDGSDDESGFAQTQLVNDGTSEGAKKGWENRLPIGLHPHEQKAWHEGVESIKNIKHFAGQGGPTAKRVLDRSWKTMNRSAETLGIKLPSQSFYDHHRNALHLESEMSQLAAPEIKPKTEFHNAPKKSFSKAAITEFITAYQSDVQPLIDRLMEIYKIEDPAIFKNRMAAFLSDVDKIKRSLGYDSEAAQAIQKCIGTSLANGIASKPAPRNPIKPTASVSNEQQKAILDSQIGIAKLVTELSNDLKQVKEEMKNAEEARIESRLVEQENRISELSNRPVPIAPVIKQPASPPITVNVKIPPEICVVPQPDKSVKKIVFNRDEKGRISSGEITIEKP